MNLPSRKVGNIVFYGLLLFEIVAIGIVAYVPKDRFGGELREIVIYLIYLIGLPLVMTVVVHFSEKVEVRSDKE